MIRMQQSRRQTLQLAGAAMMATACPRFALAADYPARTVRVIVGFAPGGVTDVFTRLVAQKLSDRLGKQFYVENVTGGSGNLGAAQVASGSRRLHDPVRASAPSW